MTSRHAPTLRGVQSWRWAPLLLATGHWPLDNDGPEEEGAE